MQSKNVMVISGDSILDFNITEFIDTHILQNSLLSMALSREDQKFVNQRLTHLNNEIDLNIYGLQNLPKCKENYKSLVYKSKMYEELSKNNLKEKGEKLKFSKKLLNSCKDFDLLYNYDDANVYLFNKQVFNIIEDQKVRELNPMFTDFIGFLINNSHSPRIRKLVSDSNKEEEQLSQYGSENEIKKKKKLEKIKITGLILEKSNYV